VSALLLLLPIIAGAAPEELTQPIGVHAAAQESLAFARYLYEYGEFSAAVVEARRAQFLTPDPTLKSRASLLIAFTKYRAGNYQGCIQEVTALLAETPENYNLLVLQGLALVKLGDGTGYRLVRQVAEADSPSAAARERAVIALLWGALERAMWPSARYWLEQVPPESSLARQTERLTQKLMDAELLPSKKPALAGGLAAIIPGAGHLYCQRPRDAITALLLNGLFIWGTVECFAHDQEAAGIILGSLELTWYVGNVVSAVNVAHRYNQRQVHSYLEELSREGVTGEALDARDFAREFLDD